MKGKTKSIRNAFRQYGLKGGMSFYFYDIIKKLFKIEIRKSTFFVRKLEDCKYEGPDFQSLSLEDFEVAADNEKNPIRWFTKDKMRIIDNRLKRSGLAVFGRFEEGILSCHGWINYDANSIGKVGLNNRDAYLFDDFTDFHFRGHGYQRQIIKFRLKEARDKGCERAWSNVYSFNHVSKKNYMKCGFIPVIRLWAVRFKNGKVKNKFTYLPNSIIDFMKIR